MIRENLNLIKKSNREIEITIFMEKYWESYNLNPEIETYICEYEGFHE